MGYGDLAFQGWVVGHLSRRFGMWWERCLKKLGPLGVCGVGAGSGAASGADIADTLRETFCHNSSSFNCSESFQGVEREGGGLG